MKFISIILFLLINFLVTNAQYQQEKSVVGGGSGMSNNGTYKLNGQIGEINGNASNGTLTIEGGFFTNMGFTLANVVTSSISSVGLNFAIGGGNVNDNGGSEVTARGIVWSNTTNPTLTTNELGHTSMV